MKRYYRSVLYSVLVFLVLFTACTPQPPTALPQAEDLTVSMLYPVQTTEVEMGKALKSIIRVTDERGNIVKDAQVTLSFSNPDGEQVASIPANFGDGDVYRSEAWPIPHKMQDGNWTIRVEAKTDTHQGTMTTTFRVKNSISETLLYKYGFWSDAPDLRGIVPSLFKESGDAQNGVIIWGGTILTQHIFPENWLEIHWRAGNFNLKTAEEVRQFMLNELGDLGFTPLREIGPFEQVKFKNWDAWQGAARGQFLRYDGQWMVFYAPEVNKTYAIGTTVVQAPTGIDAHAYLRDGFEIHPEVDAQGVAPRPLSRLLPPPELVSPELGARFTGTDQPITLVWKPVKELAEDEYYLVRVDYNYIESNPLVKYTTRETRFTLPESLYQQPNCNIFNWRVTLMRQTGLDENGQPKGEPLSFNSLYWYVEWLYPLGETPFLRKCPNEQF
ncbi:MAG TPA: hypothetical protein VFQ13_00235 [Anaerolineales bacterium]|nr:hypothetical protein [Anaerolineales bacterium]